MAIIEVDQVSKEYRLGALQGFRQTLAHLGQRLAGRPVEARPRFKALDEINLSVEEGEVVGLIGHNGAGKSTLLKLLSRITVPTSGRVSVKGRVAPLIEVGAGLVPDLTGRENIYLNGAILGLRRTEIARRFDEIVAFSELESFIDTPVKKYSSGMKVRLGFAIASSIEAEILIVDEVLAVGDLAFQRKCFDRMESVIRREGRTVILVSHNIRQVERISSRVVLLDHGRIAMDGNAREVCNRFFEKSDEKIQQDCRDMLTLGMMGNRIRSSGVVDLVSLRLCTDGGGDVEVCTYGGAVNMEIVIDAFEDLRNPIFALGIHTPDFLYITTPRSVNAPFPRTLPRGRHTVRAAIESFPFLPGTYALRASVSEGEITRTVLYVENAWHFRVVAKGVERSEVASEGFIGIDATWSLSADPAITAAENKLVASAGRE